MTLLAVFFFVGMNLLIRYLLYHPSGQPIPTQQKAFSRMLAGVIIILSLAAFRVIRLHIGNLRLLLLRGAFGTLVVVLYFHALDNTSLARATFFFYTYMAWGAVFSHFFLSEPLGWKRLPWVVLTYLGALLILIEWRKTGDVTWHGDLAGILSGLFAGVAAVVVRALHRSDSIWMIFFSMNVVSSLVCGSLMVFAEGYVAPSASEWVILVLIGLTGTAAHLVLILGFKYLDVPTVGALETLAAPFTAVAAFLVFSEPMGVIAMTGGVVLFSGAVLLAATSRAKTMEKAVEPTVP
jgi:drug/metabolite transporter (DMT)-like permease